MTPPLSMTPRSSTQEPGVVTLLNRLSSAVSLNQRAAWERFCKADGNSTSVLEPMELKWWAGEMRLGGGVEYMRNTRGMSEGDAGEETGEGKGTEGGGTTVRPTAVHACMGGSATYAASRLLGDSYVQRQLHDYH